MKRRFSLLLFASIILLGGLLVSSSKATSAHTTIFDGPRNCVNASTTTTLQGTLGGANYTIAVPSNWNGTLVLYSHGYVFTNQPLPKPAPDAGDTLTATALLHSGYALAGSSYSQNGWALQQAFHDQIALLDFFNATCGHPARTIAWGHSLGGMITAGLVQLYPERFAGALPMCGVVAGGVGTWNQALDAAFAFNVLLAGNALSIVHITDPASSYNQASAILAAAQKTPEGRARIALFSSFADIPGWFSSSTLEPTKTDYATQEYNQFLWASQVDFLFSFFGRAELEARAGGNPSWNTDVNYRDQLEHAINTQEVKALYEQAGLSLNADLNSLATTQRIPAEARAVYYLNRYISFNGDLDIPVLTMHTTGDGLVVNEDEQAYKSAVQQRGDASLLREVFVHRAGHCTFTPAETVTAFQTLLHRINTGTWGNSTAPDTMNQEALALGATLNIAPPSFIPFTPSVFLRPFNISNEA